jgi:hypothetical protein
MVLNVKGTLAPRGEILPVIVADQDCLEGETSEENR